MKYKKLKLYYLTAMLILFFTVTIFSQEKDTEKIKGIVTYKTSQNIYVKFDRTDGIAAGDTLYHTGNKEPVLLVKYLSSHSCAGQLLPGKVVNVNDELFAFVKLSPKNDSNIIAETNRAEPDISNSSADTFEQKYKKESIENFEGRFSVQSHSNFSNIASAVDYQRWRYKLNFDYSNIGGSDLSFSNYLTFTYRASEWGKLKGDLGRSLRVYDLALNYKINTTTELWFGRHLDSRISNISLVDGLIAKKKFDIFEAGAVIGSRPNFSDMGLNTKLVQFGAYISRKDTVSGFHMDNSAAIFEQTNDLKTDRQFLYFQHSNNIIPHGKFFVSSEIDLFKKESGVNKHTFRLTSLFLSASYSPLRAFSVSASYDARKNVYYYETFKNYIDSLIDNATRQGFRVSTNIRAANNLFVGLNAGYRYKPGDLKPSRNYGGYISYSLLPFIESSASINFTVLSSSYLNASIIGGRLSRSFFKGDAGLSLAYRSTVYDFAGSAGKLHQKSFAADISYRINRMLFFSISYEGTFENSRTYGRILSGISTRF